MGRPYYYVSQSRAGWVVQPSVSRSGRGDSWKHYPQIAGPFRTKKIATRVKQHISYISVQYWEKFPDWFHNGPRPKCDGCGQVFWMDRILSAHLRLSANCKMYSVHNR